MTDGELTKELEHRIEKVPDVNVVCRVEIADDGDAKFAIDVGLPEGTIFEFNLPNDAKIEKAYGRKKNIVTLRGTFPVKDGEAGDFYRKTGILNHQKEDSDGSNVRQLAWDQNLKLFGPFDFQGSSRFLVI